MVNDNEKHINLMDEKLGKPMANYILKVEW